MSPEQADLEGGQGQEVGLGGEPESLAHRQVAHRRDDEVTWDLIQSGPSARYTAVSG